tara:strand:- start:115 stop:408 length:294 start_codon:yes stop_codon:yes gene_type:complete
MRLFFTLITFFLTFNSYALAEDKFSANPRRCLDENANYNKIIEKSNETIKLWTEVKAYDCISKAKALRMTKLEFIEGKYGKEYKHPFFWAPYILVGN